MINFPNHTLESAPVEVRPVLEAQRQKYGMIPNLYARMAEAPALLQSYLDVAQRFASSGLTPVQQQVVLLTVSRINRCSYCVGVHSVLADMGGVPVEVTNAIRDDTPVPDSKLEALRQFTTRLVEDRGWVNETEVLTFIEAGYTRANVLDVIVGVGLKTLSNYINHIAGTELDASFAGRAWQAPA